LQEGPKLWIGLQNYYKRAIRRSKICA